MPIIRSPALNAVIRSWSTGARSLLPWVVPAILSVYIKCEMLRVWFGGIPSGGHNPVLRVLERLSFFRADLLWGFVIIPAGLLVLARYLPVRRRTLFMVLLSASVSAVLFLQLRAFREVGEFITLHMFLAALRWGLRDPAVISTYLSAWGFAAILGALVVVAGVVRWAARLMKDHRFGSLPGGGGAGCVAWPAWQAWSSLQPWRGHLPLHQ